MDCDLYAQLGEFGHFEVLRSSRQSALRNRRGHDDPDGLKGEKNMSGKTYAVIQQNLELRSKALEANSEELPHLEIPLGKLNGLLGEAKGLTAQQASLTAAKQEVSKRLAELMREGEFLRSFLDAGVKQHYGNRSEKLVEFGLQPFRPQPRIRLVGPDGEPLKRTSVKPEPSAPTENR
jgi:hypothetical protein